MHPCYFFPSRLFSSTGAWPCGGPLMGEVYQMSLEALAGDEATIGVGDRGQTHMGPAALTEKPQEGHHTDAVLSP